MKIINKLLLFTFCLGFLTIVFGQSAVASQANKNLSSATTYEFTNNDPFSTVYVTFTGNTLVHYDYVVKDKDGSVVAYGVSSGRFQVRNGGSTVVRLRNRSSAEINYNSGKVSVREVGGNALWRSSVAKGASLTLANLNTDRSLDIAVDNVGRTAYARYDLVVRDENGRVVHYAGNNMFTSITIPSGGSITLTGISDGGLNLMTPASWPGSEVKVNARKASAVSTHTILAGKSFTLINLSQTDGLDVKAFLGNSMADTGLILHYDYISKDELGNVTGFGQASQQGLPVFTLGAAESLTVTPDRTAGNITLQYPTEWQNESLRIAESNAGALREYTIGIGQSCMIVNNSASAAYTFLPDRKNPSTIVDYVYITPFDMDFLTNVRFDQMTVEPGCNFLFTVKRGYPLTLLVPGEWLADIAIQPTEGMALSTYTVPSGQTMRFTNNDLTESHTVSFKNGSQGSVNPVIYDYVLADEFDTICAIDARQGSQAIYPGGSLTFTARGNEPIDVWFPASWDGTVVTVQSWATQAVYRYTLPAGKSVTVTNATAETVGLAFKSASATGMVYPIDYVAKDYSGAVADFGSAGVNQPFYVEEGQVSFTNRDRVPVTLYFPQQLIADGVRPRALSGQVLYRKTIRDNEPTDIVNMDKRYDRYVMIEGSGTKWQSTDYVERNDRNAILGYGIIDLSGAKRVTVISGGKTTIAADKKGSQMTVYYPSEWDGKIIRLSVASEMPLYRRTLKPDERLTINNSSASQGYLIQNSSSNGQGRYYIRYGTDSSKITQDETPLTGGIEIYAGMRTTLTVARGFDLEIWMPREWTRRLVIS